MATHDERVNRLIEGSVDLALMDLASFTDTIATRPEVGARCVYVLTQRIPMAAHSLEGTIRGTSPEERLRGLSKARYAAPPDSNFVKEHRALLRRIDGDDPDLAVPMPYGQMFEALASGMIEVAPDFAAISKKYEKSSLPRKVDTLAYRESGIDAYGIGFVASRRGLLERRDQIATFLETIDLAYEAMRLDPAAVIERATFGMPTMDPSYALVQWNNEEEKVVFGYEAAEGLGNSSESGWRATSAWRAEVRLDALTPSHGLLAAKL